MKLRNIRAKWCIRPRAFWPLVIVLGLVLANEALLVSSTGPVLGGIAWAMFFGTLFFAPIPPYGPEHLRKFKSGAVSPAAS